MTGKYMTEQTNITALPIPEKVLNSRFLKAVRREPVDVTPIWLMRQAGRYMEEYRKLRERYGILDLIKTPELAVEVTMQPIHAFDLDAAIIFADILPPLEGMGLSLEFIKGEGPVLHNPVRTRADVEALTVRPPQETLYFTLEAITLARQGLDPLGIPLIGFSGAPFTLAAYAVEGGGSRNHETVKALMMSEPETWHLLMDRFATVAGEYLKAQAEAGALALQLFDSWVGALSPADYRQYVQPYSRKAIKIAKESGVPLIHFGTGTSGMLEDIRDAGGDVIGVDWRIDLGEAWRRLGDSVAVQGNLDPIALLASWDGLKTRAQYVLDQADGRQGHIFNLGHGIHKTTPPDNVKRLAEFVHEYTGQK
jgi:uroporphyrinogen decarboxylase